MLSYVFFINCVAICIYPYCLLSLTLEWPHSLAHTVPLGQNLDPKIRIIEEISYERSPFMSL